MKYERTGVILSTEKYDECVAFYSEVLDLPIIETLNDLADTVVPSVKAMRSAATLRRVARVLPETCRNLFSSVMIGQAPVSTDVSS